ncbi:MAG: hypothetical protein RLO81_05950 [Fulvivirga sp.]|uniref:hypothetical protein n=1 Tax=Fulvivirga sp. TaxID=1931237 RepID=UPI0032EE31B5
MKSALNVIIYSGTSDLNDPHLNRRILFSNVIFLTLPVVYGAFMILDIKAYIQPISDMNFDQFTVPITMVYCLVGIYLNKIGFSYLGRFLFLILWPLLMHILPIIILNTPEDYYLAYPMGLIFHSVLIQLIISSKNERGTYLFFMLLSLVLIILCKDFLLYYDSNYTQILNDTLITSKYYSLVAILYWLLFNAITYYVIMVLDQLIEKNEKQQLKLIENNEELNSLNIAVENINKSLEEKVRIRTLELNNANEKLSSYAFHNAHLINGPFCRIKGLLMLKDLNAIDDIDLNEKLRQSIQELDEAIHDMQVNLNQADIKK